MDGVGSHCAFLNSELLFTEFVLRSYAFVFVPFEGVRHRFVLDASECHFDEGDRQRLFHDDEVILGDAERVHVRWIQQPPAWYAGHDRCLIEHGEFLLFLGVIRGRINQFGSII